MKIAGILAVLALGMGLGWLLASHHHGRGNVPAVPPAGEPPPAAAAPAPATPPELRGRATPPGPEAPRTAPGDAAAGAGGAPGVREVLPHLREDELEAWVGWELGLSDDLSRDQRVWRALLTLYAVAGRTEDFERAVPRAMEAGLQPAQVLEMLGLLPADLRVATIDNLRAALPDVTWPVAHLADVYIAAGAGDHAVDILLPALEASPTADLARRLVTANPERAAHVLAAIASAGELPAELLGEIGSAFVDVERGDLALPFLEDALRADPFDRGVLDRLAQVDATLALAHVRTLTAENPERADVWTWRGEIEWKAGNAAAAFEAYRKAAALQLSTDALYGMMKADPERAFPVALELASESSDDEVMGAVAKLALKDGRRTETMETLLRAHARDPTDHEWMVAMVALDPAQAAEALEATASTYGGDSRDEVVGAWGNALLALGRSDEAFARYEEAFELDPGDWEWQRGLARTDPARAVEVLEARRRDAGPEGDLLGALGDAYAGSGRPAEAVDLYAQAIQGGGGVEWYARMALVDPQRARRELDQQVAERSGDAEVWAALGDLHRELGETSAAHAAYERARELNPTSLLYEIRWRATSGD